MHFFSPVLTFGSHLDIHARSTQVTTEPMTAPCPGSCFLPECDVVEWGILKMGRDKKKKSQDSPGSLIFPFYEWMEQQLSEKASPLCVMSYEAGFSVTAGCDWQCCLVFLSMQNVHFTARIGKMISLGCSQEEWDLLGISGRPPSKGPLRGSGPW